MSSSNGKAVMKVGGGRTILVDVFEDGPFPQLVTLDMRPASSAPTGTRVKFSLVATGGLPLPVAASTVIGKGLVVESRMEMN